MSVKFDILATQVLLQVRGLEADGRTQKFIDNEILKQSDAYVPMDEGDLKKSGTIHTKVGSGEVKYRTPYARKQYYENNNPQGLRGRRWFDRMKADHLEEILRGAKEVAGAE